jgi:ketosteroid isomerase-like protein
MSSGNAAVIRGIYDAFAAGDVEAVLAAMSPDIVWNEAENVPYADNNPYCGPEAVLSGVFGRLGTEWDGFAAVIDEILDAGDAVVALGHYQGTYRATGQPIRAQLAHVWRLADGKAVAFQQYTDTLQVARATGGDTVGNG